MHIPIRRRVALSAACLATVVSFSACGSDDDSATDTSETAAATPTRPPPLPRPPPRSAAMPAKQSS